MCGDLLPAVRYDGFSPRFPGVGQVEMVFRRECPHTKWDVGAVWGGYVCSEGCGILVREWLLTAGKPSVCPNQHRAKGLHGNGVSLAVMSLLQ